MAIGARNTSNASGAAAANDGLGWSVGLVGDSIVAGAAGADSPGAGYLFNRSGSVWAQTMLLPVSGLTTGNEFGRFLAYSGTVAVVMAPNFLGNRGAGFVYEFPVISTAPTLVSLAVTPVNPSVALGLTQQFTATGTYSNGSAQNLTATATGLGNDGHRHHQQCRSGGHRPQAPVSSPRPSAPSAARRHSR